MRHPDGLVSRTSALRRTIGMVRPELRTHRGLVFGGCVALLADVAFRVLEPWPMKIVIDSVLTSLGADIDYRSASVALLVGCGLAYLLVVAARAGSNYLATVCFALVGARVAASLRSKVFHHVQGLSQQFHARNRSADTVQRMVGDIARLQEVAITAGMPLLVNVVTLLVMLCVMFALSPPLALTVVVAIIAFAVVSNGSSRRITSASRRTRQGEGHLANTAQESLATIRVVQAYGLEQLIERRFGGANQASARQGVKALRAAAGLERGTDLIIGVAAATVLVWGGFRVLDGAITPGELVLFTNYLRTTMKPMRDLAKYTGRIARAGASGERVADLMETRSDVVDPVHPVRLTSIRGDIRFDGVVTAYDGVEVLHGLDLTVRPGEQVAIVGPSGAGKSTLVSLLVRAIDPVRGQVLLDGHPLTDLALGQLRGNIALLHQEAVLFTGTIRENIGFGRPDASDSEIEAAARAANAHEFIVALPEGYETTVGERGDTLSGGQRQRVAIARALLRNAPVVILDEVTTGLDSSAAVLVLDAIGRLATGRTLLAVTHDVEVAMRCGRIVWIEDGRIRMNDTPQQLLATSPVFRAWANAVREGSAAEEGGER